MELLLRKSTTVNIKGLAIILLLTHHFSGMDFAYDFLHIFKSLGPIICVAFFFCSGYGLYKKFSTADTHYWFSKIKFLYTSFVIANLLYIAYALISGSTFSLLELIGYASGVTLINGHCWFLQVILLFYFVLSVATLFRFKWFNTICLVAMGGSIYSIITNQIFTISWIGFIFGFLSARYKIKIKSLYLTIIFLLFIGSFLFYFSHGNLINTPLLLLNFIVMLVTVIPLWIIVGNLNLGLQYLGERSLDFYIMHGLALRILSTVDFSNRFFYIAAYAILVVLTAKVFELITTKSNKYIFA